MPLYRYLIALSSINGHIGIFKYYELFLSLSVKALKPLLKVFSTENVKKCFICRDSFRNINRYNRIIRQNLIEEAIKKFIF